MLTQCSTPAVKARCCCERHREDLALFGCSLCFSLTIVARDHFSHLRVYVTDQSPPMLAIHSKRIRRGVASHERTQQLAARKRAVVRAEGSQRDEVSYHRGGAPKPYALK